MERHCYSLKTAMIKAVLVVISLLLMILIYSSVVKFDVFAKPKVYATCYDKTRLPGGGYAMTCCHVTDYGGGVKVTDDCTRCNYDSTGLLLFDTCKDVDPRTVQLFNPPRNVGNALLPLGNNTGTLPQGGIIKVPPGTTNTLTPIGNNTGNATTPGNNFGTTTTVPPGILKPAGNATNTPPPPPQPPKNVLPPSSTSSQTICPNGSTLDANGKCLSTTTNQKLSPPSSNLEKLESNNNNNNNPPSDHHHHKGSDLGQESTKTTTKKGNNEDNGGGSSSGEVPKTDQEKK